MGRFDDEFEVVCIGALYQGKWQRRYWSNFRAKDKYPFPVGYKARRMYDGHRYTMEIREGLRGPLFEVTSEDGFARSGETATAAWQKALSGTQRLQKRLWSGQDGLEVFGFKHQSVQRLLQELTVENPASGDDSSRYEEPAVAHESDMEDIATVAHRQDGDDQSVSRTGHRASEDVTSGNNIENEMQLRGPIGRKRKHELQLPPRKQQCMESDLCTSDVRPGGNQPAFVGMDREPGKRDVEGLSSLGFGQCSSPTSGSGDAAEHGPRPLLETGVRHEIHADTDTNLGDESQSSKMQVDSSAVEYIGSQGDVFLRSRCRPIPMKRFRIEVAPDRRNKLGVATTLLSDEEVDLEMDTESEDMEDQRATYSVSMNSESQLSIGQRVTRDMIAIWFAEALPTLDRKTDSVKEVKTHVDLQTVNNVHHSHLEDGIIPLEYQASPVPTSELCCNDASDQQQPHQHAPQTDPPLDSSKQHGSLSSQLTSLQEQERELEGSAHKQFEELKSLPDQKQNIPARQTADDELCMKSSEITRASISHSPEKKQGSVLTYEKVRGGDDVKVREDWWNTVSPSEFLYSSQELLEVVAGCQNHGCSAPVLPNLHDASDNQPLREGLEEQHVAGAVALAVHKSQEEELPPRASPSPFQNKTPQKLIGHLARCSIPKVDELYLQTCSIGKPGLSTGLQNPLLSCEKNPSPVSDHLSERNNLSVAGRLTETNACMGEHLNGFHLRHKMSGGHDAPLEPGHFRGPNPCAGDCYDCGPSVPNNHLLPDPLSNHGKQFDWENSTTCDVRDTAERGNGTLASNNLCEPPDIPESSKTLVVPEIESSAPTCIGHISHPSPVKSMWLTVFGDIIQLCVCCSADGERGQMLFIYRTQHVENDDVEFFLWTSFMICVRPDVDANRDTNEQGFAFFPIGDGLVMLDYFCIPKEWERSNFAAEDNGLQILRFNSQGVWLQSQLRCATGMQCISVPRSQLIIAAAADGQLNCWEMDGQWKFCQESFLLPNANAEAGTSTVSQLLTLPGFPNLISGCYSNGSFAIWDHSLRVLLRWFESSRPDLALVRADTLPLAPPATVATTQRTDSLRLSQARQSVYATENVVPENNLGLFDRAINLCFLVQTRSVEQVSHAQRAECYRKETGPVAFRYAILRGDVVSFTRPLDDRACSASVGGHYAVFGTYEGETFLVDTSSGNKLISFQELEGSPIMSVITDSRTGIFAAAAECGVAIYA